MRLSFILPASALVASLSLGCRGRSAAQGRVETQTLTNGIRVVVLYLPGSTNAALFSFLPLGWAGDGPGQGQWSHLVEHLVVRSTIPADSQTANAETLPDHLRLDFYGTVSNWREGLAHHRRWLAGVPFTEESLATEKPKVNAECDFTARNLATHKFAIAAWNQAYRHGQPRVELQGDVLQADLAQIQRYRDDRLVVLDKVTVCLVGGIAPDTALPILATELGGIRSSAKLPGPVKAKGGSLAVVWDLPARHLLLTWPIPDPVREGYAALMVAGQWLTMRLSRDPALKATAGMAFAGADLITAEGAYFYVSVALKPEATFEGVREVLNAHLRALRTGGAALAEVPMLAQQLGYSLNTVPGPAVLQGPAPPNVSPAMLEANIGLQYGMNEHRYGPRRAALGKQLAAVTAAKVQTAAQKHLSDEKLTICAIRSQ